MVNHPFPTLLTDQIVLKLIVEHFFYTYASVGTTKTHWKTRFIKGKVGRKPVFLQASQAPGASHVGFSVFLLLLINLHSQMVLKCHKYNISHPQTIVYEFCMNWNSNDREKSETKLKHCKNSI